MTLRTDKELDDAWNKIKKDLELELARTVNMVEVQKVVIGETRFKKHLYSVLKKLKIRLKDQGLDDAVITDMLKAILFLYYGNHQKVGGIFKEDFERLGMKESSFIDLAHKFNVVHSGDMEGNEYWRLEEKYMKAGSELADKKVEERREELKDKLREFPNKIVALFAFMLEPEQWRGHTTIAKLSAWDGYVLPYPANDHYGFFGLKPFQSILKEDTFDGLNEIAKRLIDLDLGLNLTSYLQGDSYVDYKLSVTRYHLIKKSYFVTCPEVIKEIKNILRKRTGKAEPRDILANELRKYKVHKFLDEWLPTTLRQTISPNDFERLLKTHNISFENLKEELKEYEQKGLVVFGTLEDEPPLSFEGDSKEKDLKKSFGKIMKSLENSILASFTSD
jgi:hypothetical protein